LEERFYKIGEVAEILEIEQHTLRYLENSLKLKIKRNERGDRLYTDSDLDTLRLVLQLKSKGLNTTAIKLALENTEESEETSIAPSNPVPALEIVEVVSLAREIRDQNMELLQQNRRLEQRLEKLEQKVEERNREREKKIEEFLNLWKAEQESKKSWFSRLRGK
jgi:DNA-binding transcriptional MerR regulator